MNNLQYLINMHEDKIRQSKLGLWAVLFLEEFCWCLLLCETSDWKNWNIQKNQMALWYVCTLHSGLNSAEKTDSSGILEECGKNFEWISKPSGLPYRKSSLILVEDRRWLNLRKFFILAQIPQKMYQTTIHHQKRKYSW